MLEVTGLFDWQVRNTCWKALHSGIRKLFRTALILETEIVTFYRAVPLEILRGFFVRYS